jgi:hypothetical protein
LVEMLKCVIFLLHSAVHDDDVSGCLLGYGTAFKHKPFIMGIKMRGRLSSSR